MQKNYKIAWRSILKTKGYSALNIGGLALGMAVTILIGLWIFDELSFDNYFINRNRIAQVWQKSSFNGEKSAFPALPRPLEFELRNKYGNDFKQVVMCFWEGDHVLTAG